MQKVTEPEGLYPSYRTKTTLQILELVTKGISFKIQGEYGVDKSKYLRYICSSPTLLTDYWQPNQVKLCYIDLNLLYENSTESIAQSTTK